MRCCNESVFVACSSWTYFVIDLCISHNTFSITLQIDMALYKYCSPIQVLSFIVYNQMQQMRLPDDIEDVVDPRFSKQENKIAA